VLSDAIELSKIIRQADLDEIEISTDQSPLECLVEPFTQPNRYQTYSLIGNEGEVVGMFGINVDGVVWMISSDLLYSKYLRQFLQQTRHWINVVQGSHNVIYNYVDPRNRRSLMWLQYVGFEISPQTQPHGPWGHPFHLIYRFRRNDPHVYE
jgi:hypothetical protein